MQLDLRTHGRPAEPPARLRLFPDAAAPAAAPSLLRRLLIALIAHAVPGDGAWIIKR